MPDTIPVAEATGPGPVTHLIQVQCDMATYTVTIARPRVSIKPGDMVVWSFTGLPEGWSPWIELRHGENGAFSGPLTGLTQSAGGVWGVCREEWTETTSVPFDYRASIQSGFGSGWSGAGSVLWSAPAVLDVLPGGIGEELVYTITLGTGDKPSLVVEPIGQVLNPGDTMVWQFPEVPDGDGSWRPRIDFYRYEGEGSVPNRYLGPFAALAIEPGRIRGTGNNDVPGVYFFEVALVQVGTGLVGWVSSGDPVVDNRGGVSTPDG